MTQSTHPPSPEALISTRARLERLDELLTRPETDTAELGQLAAPEALAQLFDIALRTQLRATHREPSMPTPSLLLAKAQRASELGALPLATPGRLRTELEQLGDLLRTAGAWSTEHPLWWEPLPAPTAAERLGVRVARTGDRWPSQKVLREAFSARSWATAAELLEPALLGELHQQLETAYQAGYLDLERAGVGASERVSDRRSDAVLYLNGHEPELLRAAPAAAAWIQWCLEQLGRRLAAALGGRPIFPPASAMLARYPAPSAGFHPHLDNPGEPNDNGRTVTLVLYLNGLETPCSGGEIALWNTGRPTTEPPAEILPAHGGNAVLFDARTIPHQVRPLLPGPARWALTLWFNDAPQRPPEPSPPPDLTLTDLLLPIAEPPLPPDTVLFHELDDATPAGTLTVYPGTVSPGTVHPTTVRPAAQERPRIGLISTVYRAGSTLDAWVRHHLELGFAHLLLVFDHLEEPAEAEQARLLTARYGDRLTVWAGSDVAENRWPNLAESLRHELEQVAGSGASNPAIAARQTLNASAALGAARRGELGGRPLDWLLHLDADELFVLEGAGRGGATLSQHFAAADRAGLHCLRYANHELLHSDRLHSGRLLHGERLLHSDSDRLSFKLNPRLAAAKLGAVGWSKLVAHLEMAQTDLRPYFTGYFNGKSAVRVDSATSAAGVHSWSLDPTHADAHRFLAGPSVLHFHLTSRVAFRAKYLAVAGAEVLPGPALFTPSPLEETVLQTIRDQQRAGADTATLERELDRLHARMTTFADSDVELLEAAGLVLTPRLQHPLPLHKSTASS
ncbi:MAG: 2OG-Fe(II) oxygenase [Acidobacteriota bacterium]